MVGRRLVVVAPDPDCRRHGIPSGVASILIFAAMPALAKTYRTAEARLYAERSRVVYRYAWQSGPLGLENPRRAALKGRE